MLSRMIYKVTSFKRGRRSTWDVLEPLLRTLVRDLNGHHPTRPIMRLSGAYHVMYIVEQFDSRVQWAEWEEGPDYRRVMAAYGKEVGAASRKLDATLQEDFTTELFADALKGWEAG